MNTIKLNTIGTPFPKAEGGGGDTPSGGGTMEYLDVSGVNAAALEGLVVTSIYMNVTLSDVGDVVVPSAYALYGNPTGVGVTPKKVAICFSLPFMVEGQEMQVVDILASLGVTSDQLAAIPRITEEEFYTIETA